MAACRCGCRRTICLVGLLVDLYTPLGVANGMIYVPLILTSLWFSSRTAPFNLAFVCSILILLGLLAIDRHGENYGYEAMNRAITVAMLWLVAGFVFSFQRKSDSLDAERIRFDTVTRNTPNAIIAIDPKGTISLFNPAAEQMFGYSAAEAIGQNVHMLLPEAYHAGLDAYFQRICGPAKEQDGNDQQHLRAAPERRHVSARCVAERLQDRADRDLRRHPAGHQPAGGAGEAVADDGRPVAGLHR
jgi:PAS domain S-box-containing protein